jgi:hypothetical protein
MIIIDMMITNVINIQIGENVKNIHRMNQIKSQDNLKGIIRSFCRRFILEIYRSRNNLNSADKVSRILLLLTIANIFSNVS